MIILKSLPFIVGVILASCLGPEGIPGSDGTNGEESFVFGCDDGVLFMGD